MNVRRSSPMVVVPIAPTLKRIGHLLVLGWGLAGYLYCQTPVSRRALPQLEIKPAVNQELSLFAPLPVTSNSGSGQNHPAAPATQNSAGENGSPKHIFWVIPAYKVDYLKNVKPLTPREKFDQWAKGAYDPLGLGIGALEAAVEYSPRDGFCGYGKGIGNYGKCFGSAELDANTSSFIGDFVFTVLLHQDPRYFGLGSGPAYKRIFYAISRVFITRTDSGKTTIDSSALSGTVISAALSNLYYPRQDRGFDHSLSRVGWDLGDTAAYNLAAEFWPDIHRKLHKIF